MNQITQQHQQPVQQPMPTQPQPIPQGQEVVEKKSGWFKWLIIVLVVLIVLGGLAWRIFAL